jgi:hypothetical protein
MSGEATAKDPNELLTCAEVSSEFKIPQGTLGAWRFRRIGGDTACPRFYRRGRRILYKRYEIEQDLAKITVPAEVLEF